MRGEVRHALRERLILDTASELLRARGYVGVSMEDVARATGVGKATLYKHFDSKEELVVAVFIDHMSKAEELFRGLPPKLPALERLERLLVQGVTKRTEHAPIPIDQVPTAVKHHPRFLGELMRMHGRMVELLEEARRAGELRPDLSTDVLAALLMSTFGPELEATAERLGMRPEVLAPQLAGVVFGGMRG